jgi:hypothetical protein
VLKFSHSDQILKIADHTFKKLLTQKPFSEDNFSFIIFHLVGCRPERRQERMSRREADRGGRERRGIGASGMSEDK